MYWRNYRHRQLHCDNNKRSPSTIANNKERNPPHKNFACNYSVIFMCHYKLRRFHGQLPISRPIHSSTWGPSPKACRQTLSRVEGALEEFAVHYANRVCHTTRHNVTFAPSKLEPHQYNAGGFVLKLCMMICISQSSATHAAIPGKE